MDGKEDPYYGGKAGQLRGHKFSLFEGGIPVPAIISWPQRIPAGQVVHEAGIATDVFPTLIKAAGGDISGYECDGMDILPALCGEGSIPEREPSGSTRSKQLAREIWVGLKWPPRKVHCQKTQSSG